MKNIFNSLTFYAKSIIAFVGGIFILFMYVFTKSKVQDSKESKFEEKVNSINTDIKVSEVKTKIIEEKIMTLKEEESALESKINTAEERNEISKKDLDSFFSNRGF